MPELGAVRRLEGPLLVEQVRNDLIDAIQRCDLMPGQAVSLRRVAEERRVRPGTLAMLLRQEEKEGLLDIRGDVVVVAPLRPGNLVSAFRLSRLSESAVIPKACESVSPTELSRLERLIPHPESVGSDYDRFLVTRVMDFATELLAPTLTTLDRHLHDRINYTSRRYANLTARYLVGSRYSPDFSSFFAAHHELVDLLRAGRVRAASSLNLQLSERYRLFAEASLELPQLSDDDQPIAQVIPIRPGARSDLGRGRR